MTTTTNSRLLLPQLPPELRNEIYSYLSTHDDTTTSTATEHFLPFQLKRYECKHISITIHPVHHGSNNLLALQQYRFQEAYEYHTWLQANALELCIKVVFKGKINTFIQADWTKKLESHLHKLVKQHAWLRKVARHSIQIHWDAADGVLKGRKKMQPTGRIPRAMVEALTRLLMDEEVKRKHGCVKVRLLLPHRIAVEHVLSGTNFGLGVFSAAPAPLDEGLKEFTIEAWKTPHLVAGRDADAVSDSASGAARKSGKVFLALGEDGSGRHVDVGPGELLMKKRIRQNQCVEIVWGKARCEVGMVDDHVLGMLMRECLG